MLRCFTDENVNNDITRGLRLRQPLLDIVRIQETDVAGAVREAIEELLLIAECSEPAEWDALVL